MLGPRINNTYKSFSPEKAEQVAAELNAVEDDDWTYVVRHDPKGTGYSFIEVYDEDGYLIGKW